MFVISEHALSTYIAGSGTANSLLVTSRVPSALDLFVFSSNSFRFVFSLTGTCQLDFVFCNDFMERLSQNEDIGLQQTLNIR
jgi:hypothetical protein